MFRIVSKKSLMPFGFMSCPAQNVWYEQGIIINDDNLNAGSFINLHFQLKSVICIFLNFLLNKYHSK